MLPWLLLAACSPELTVTIPRDTIQQKLSAAFPIERGAPELAQVTLADPVLRLTGSDRLEVDVSLTAIVPDLDQIAVPASATTEGDGTTARAVDLLRRVGSVAMQAAAAPRAELTGDLGLSGTLAYRPEDGAFYIAAPAVRELRLDGQSEERTAQIRGLAEQGAGAVLSRVPVYTLDHDIKQEAARLLLRDVHAEPDGLKITLGP